MRICRSITMPMMLVMTLLLAGGCSSTDRHVFQSTESRPASVSLVDVNDRETLWHMDIPPEHQLVIDFGHRGEVEVFHVSGRPATYMQWKLHRHGEASAEAVSDGRRRVSGSRLELDGRPVRLAVEYHAPVRRTPSEESYDDQDYDYEVDGEAEAYRGSEADSL